MNLPYSWLKELLPGVPDVDTTVDLLAGLGLGVERVYDLPAPPRGVVVARVEEVKPVEGSDHLLQAIVTDGKARYSIVTGAPNTVPGMLTALAKVGTELPEAGFTVSHRTMQGVASEGVLCSPKELGLFEYGGGLIVFGDDAEVGRELADLWPAETVIELELTPNRADAFSILGVARDLAAKLGQDYKHPAAGLDTGDVGLEDGLTVKVEDPHGSPRFTLRLIEGVTVKPSPLWLQRRLASVGLRPRNNIVDVTNYVTFELGQPSHAYDRADLQDGTIVVRRAAAGETLTALTEVDLTFSEADLLITTLQEGGTLPIGVAGVIGGLHHSVKPGTQAVALEVAHFEPVSIRKTAKRLGLSTDAHYRFERGVDPNLPPLASARAAHLIAELGGGRVHGGLTDVGTDAPLAEIPFRPSRVKFLTAVEVPLNEQEAYLKRLGCKVVLESADLWRVTAPSWRFDMAIEEDLIEEVARMHGYDHIGMTVPNMQFVPEGLDVNHRSLRNLLVGLGLQETILYTFSSDEELRRSRAPEASVRLMSPPSSERSVLRTALFPGLLGAAVVNRNQPGLALYEIGRVFNDTEEERLAVLMRGSYLERGWLGETKVDFFVFKGLLEKLAATMGVSLSVTPKVYPALHPGVSGTLVWDGQEVGFIGRLHPEIAADYELGEVYLAELKLPLTAAPILFRDLVRQPHAERDLAIIAPKEVTYGDLETLVSSAAGERLETLFPFDVYEGQPIAEGSRSVALRLRFRHPERSLRDDEVDAFMADVTAALHKKGYDIRDR